MLKPGASQAAGVDKKADLEECSWGFILAGWSER